MSIKFLSLGLAATATALPSVLKATADNPCVPCQPQGATGTTPPAVGSDLSSLYLDVLNSVKGISFQKRTLDTRESAFCCAQTLNCVNVQGLNIPMCYDKFTTNFAFADGSYGQLHSGEYTSGANTANLLTGDYTANGQSGNIYSANAQAKPNTATLSIPPQFTGTGVGSAIPANQLGSVIVYTTTIPGKVITAPTTIPQSVEINTINGQVATTTIPAKTITQATSIAPVTSVATITQQASSQASSSPTASKSKGAAANVGIDGSRSTGLSLLGALLYFLM